MYSSWQQRTITHVGHRHAKETLTIVVCNSQWLSLFELLVNTTHLVGYLMPLLDLRVGSHTSNHHLKAHSTEIMHQDQSGARLKYYMTLSDKEEAEPVHHQWKLSAHISPSSIQSACTYLAKHSHPPWHIPAFSLLVHIQLSTPHPPRHIQALSLLVHTQLVTPTLPDTFKPSVCLYIPS